MGSSPSLIQKKTSALTCMTRSRSATISNRSSSDADRQPPHPLAHVSLWLQRIVNTHIVVVFGRESQEASRAIRKLFEDQYRLTSAEFLFFDVDEPLCDEEERPPKQLNDYFQQETGDCILPKIYIGTSYLGGIEAALQSATSGHLYDQMRLWGCPLKSHNSIDTEIFDLYE
uniref:Uncharacterized protein n=1 Tax=Plectus sambesii TaxID=2011161 RepID=A0A914WCL1_9BILA